MSALGLDDFPTYFKAIHHCDPFPWQERLARQVVETGCWPPLLDLPTGAGKTATIDVAVFHLACEAEKGPDRKAPMRILFVIDRRIVVDEASARARKVAQALHHATDGVLLKVRQRLTQLSGVSTRPLDTVRLRGGVPQERDWAQSPAQPLVAVSTVDQVGSRLLFRGYGVSSRMLPVHAGLVGADALWLLDEVHLSGPLAETLATVAAGHSPDGNGILAGARRLAPFRVVHLSATPGKDAARAFQLNDADWANEILGLRLTARKITELLPIKDEPAEAFLDHGLRLARLAQEPAKASRKKKRNSDSTIVSVPSARRVAIVVNRVNLARQIFQKVRQKIEKDHVGEAEVILLTGRVRPLDRDRLLQRLEPLFASPERTVPDKLTILVATQTVEAGADFDVDALVTEIAPLDPLRQRFGRLDRLGLRRSSRAAILTPTSADHWKALEPIYGNAAKNQANG
jgi:CRISPR-associated endonuclease/helicase Cas3